jgi:probable HAF family extracellular repeat protein
MKTIQPSLQKHLRIPLSILLVTIGCGLLFAAPTPPQYTITDLPSLGINNRTWLAGYSNLAGDQSRHATLWRNGALTDLGTLGGPNSNSPGR